MMTIEELKKNQTKKSRLLGLDLGSKRIGVSICDDKQSIATPYKTINKTNAEKLIKEILVIIEDNNIGGIIVGNPITRIKNEHLYFKESGRNRWWPWLRSYAGGIKRFWW